jgi:tetratricopeptide (TPR) repeat protein
MKEKLKQEIQVLVNKYKFGDFQGVLKKCSQLVKKFPKNDFIWNLTGLAFQQVRNNQSAITSFQNAIYANPNNISAKNNLAISYKNEKQFGKSKDILNEILKENPKYINALVNLANLQNETYFFNEALENYKKALTINSNLPEIYLNISNILQVKNEMDEAKDYLYKSLKLNKNFTTADQNLSMLLNYSDEKNSTHYIEMQEKIKDPR